MDDRVHPPRIVSVSDVLLGKRISTDEEMEESVTAATGVPVLGLDALASAAYGPEALLTVLLPLGLAALHGMIVLVPLLALVLILLFVSYRQTIPAYPGGGGAYTVAKENLGARPSLVAAAAGVRAPVLLHRSSETIGSELPGWRDVLIEDFRHSMVFDTAKLRALVPGFAPRWSYSEGARAIVAYHDADPARRQIDAELERAYDTLAARP